jgi:protein gp37
MAWRLANIEKTKHKYKDVVCKKNLAGLPRWTGETYVSSTTLEEPFRWKKPRLVFVNSMCDTFYHGFEYWQICKLFAVMEANPQHTFQILTKRIDRAKDFFDSYGCDAPKNVWLGVSRFAHKRKWMTNARRFCGAL